MGTRLGSGFVGCLLVLGLLAAAQSAQATTFAANGATLGPIPDSDNCGPPPGAPRDVTFTAAGLPAGAPTNVAVDMTFSPNHTFLGDLVVTLIAPGGAPGFPVFGLTGATTATVGAGDDSNVAGPYTFIDSAPAAPTWWNAAAAAAGNAIVASGSYRASQVGGVGSTGANTLITPAFGAVANANGTWTLRFTDSCWDDFGTVFAANLTVGVGGDGTPPAAPALTSTNPASPANNNNPRIIGTAEAGSTVKLYSTANCTGPQLGSDTAANFATLGLQINVADNATTSIYGTATDAANNFSPCSAAIDYQELTPPPAAPNLASTNPASPANNNTPRILGAAAPGTTVRLYASDNCSGAPLATGPAADLAAPGLQITVADNTTAQIRATATLGVINVSACSPAISYQELTPATATITKSPKAKTKSKTATFEFSADATGVKFECELEGKKVKPPLNEFAPCTSPQTYKKLKPGKKTFTVHATDAAGNAGADATFSWKVKKKRK